MGNYLTHSITATPKDLDNHLGTRDIASLLADLSTNPEKQTAVDSAIDDAESTCDSYIAGRYDVPVATPPAALKGAAADLAIYNLWQRSPNMPTNISEARDDAIKWLKDVASGTATLPGASPAPTPTTGAQIQTTSNTRELTREKLNWF